MGLEDELQVHKDEFTFTNIQAESPQSNSLLSLRFWNYLGESSNRRK